MLKLPLGLMGLPEADIQHFYFLAQKMQDLHGDDPATLSQAAAHESAHLIVAQGIGEKATGARVFKTDKGWYGRNTRDSDKRPSTILEDPLLAFEAICHNQAGKIGESVAGFNYPASSLDEMYRSYLIGQALEAHWHWCKGFACFAAQRVVNHLLHGYRVQFNAIRYYIKREKRIGGTPLAALIDPVEQMDVFKLKGTDRHNSILIGQLIEAELGGFHV